MVFIGCICIVKQSKKNAQSMYIKDGKERKEK
jgi:hypothetical protein